MDAQNIELTDDAVKELSYGLEGSETSEESIQDAIKEAKQQIFNDLKKDIQKKIKDFQFEKIKVSYSLRNNTFWVLAIVKILEDNVKFLIVRIPFYTTELIKIENSSFTLNKISFDEIFRILGDNKFISIAIQKYLKKFTEPKPISDASSKKARDLFGGLMD